MDLHPHQKTPEPSPEDLRRWGQASSTWKVWNAMALLRAHPDPRAELRRMVPDYTHPDVAGGRLCPLLVSYVEGLMALREIDARDAAPASALN
jgi:hypothetical protein